VEELRALTPEEFERAAERLRNPRPGTRIAAARDYGVDLTLLIEHLRLTPAERLKRLEYAATSIEKMRKTVRRKR
jgi:hypothetical protein